MKSALALAAALVLGATGAALAQTGTSTTSQPNTSNSSASTNSSASGAQMRDRLINNLKQAGFTNVQVQAESFLVRAKDKDGDPVMMVINPDSLTEVVGANPSATNGEGRSSASGSQTESTGRAGNSGQNSH
jgi:hypothetical protein